MRSLAKRRRIRTEKYHPDAFRVWHLLPMALPIRPLSPAVNRRENQGRTAPRLPHALRRFPKLSQIILDASDRLEIFAVISRRRPFIRFPPREVQALRIARTQTCERGMARHNLERRVPPNG